MKPSCLGPLSTTDLKQFYSPPKLVTHTTPAIPNADYVLALEVFIDHPEGFPSAQDVVFIPVMTEQELPLNSITNPQTEAQKQNRKFDMLEATLHDNTARGAIPVTVTDIFSATGFPPSFLDQSLQVIDLTNTGEDNTRSTSFQDSPQVSFNTQLSCIIITPPAINSA